MEIFVWKFFFYCKVHRVIEKESKKTDEKGGVRAGIQSVLIGACIVCIECVASLTGFCLRDVQTSCCANFDQTFSN